MGLANRRFILVGKDEFSSFRMVSCLKAKSQVPETVKLMLNQAETQTGNSVLRITTDNAAEFLSERLTSFLQNKGIEQILSTPYCPQQNGIAERENQSLLAQGRTILNAHEMPKELWPEAVYTATYVSNRCITSKRNVTAYELWFQRKPNLKNLRIFGQQASVLKPDHQRGKFDEKGTIKYFVGYTENYQTYKFFDPITKKIETSPYAVFTNQIGYPQTGSNGTQSSSLTQPSTSNIIIPTDETHQKQVDMTNDDNSDTTYGHEDNNEGTDDTLF